MKLLIVDDEIRTREFLQHRIEWDKVGIESVHAAKNGALALELAAVLQPDIIICDIRMPKMDGIEFARRLRLLDLDVKLIFLSGFSDKEYLFSAIQLQAFQFIEKPINPDIVLKAVGEAAAIHQAEQERKQEELRLKVSYDEAIPILRREMVRKLITDPHSPHVMPALLDRGTFMLPPQGPYTVAAAPLFWSQSALPKDPGVVQTELLNALSGHVQFHDWRAIAGFDSHSWLVIVMPGSIGPVYSDGRARAEELRHALSGLLDPQIQFHLAIGRQAAELGDIPTAYRSAVEAGNLQFYKPYGELAFPPDTDSGEALETDWEELRSFREAVRRGEPGQAAGIIGALTTQAKRSLDLDIMRVKDVYFQFLLILLEAALQQGLTEREDEGESRYIWKEIDRIPDLERLHAYVLSFLSVFGKEENGAGAGAGKMREITRVIHTRFHEKGFGIQTIADQVNLSETYLCSFFKKQSGQTVKEYITAVRVEEAKALLANPELKLYAVAQAVGIADPNYFTTFFKKYVGLTPSEYRERLGQ